MTAAAAAIPFNPFTPAAIRSADSTLLKAMLDDPVQFREAPALVGTVDPAGKGWLEVNPLPGSSGAKAKVAAPAGKLQKGANDHVSFALAPCLVRGQMRLLSSSLGEG